MIAKFSVAVRGYTDEDADMLCLDLYIDFVSSKPHASSSGIYARTMNCADVSDEARSRWKVGE
jgi:hypothetical protein